MSNDNRLDDVGVRKTGFYSSRKWLAVRDTVRKRDGMVCQKCGKDVVGRYIVDHIKPLTMSNYKDYDVAYNLDNLQLLCISCHNNKTFTRKIERFNLW